MLSRCGDGIDGGCVVEVELITISLLSILFTILAASILHPLLMTGGDNFPW